MNDILFNSLLASAFAGSVLGLFHYIRAEQEKKFSANRSRVFDPPPARYVPTIDDTQEHAEPGSGSPYREPAPKTLEEAAQSLAASVLGLPCPACHHPVGFHGKDAGGCKKLIHPEPPKLDGELAAMVATIQSSEHKCECTLNQSQLKKAMVSG